MSTDIMEVSSLGRPFTLGMLYDARKDAILPGYILWDEETIQKNTVENSHRSSNFTVTASDSIESRSSLLDVSASIKASFLCGLIEVDGSAKYLNDKKKLKSQSRVTFQYKATTHFKQLSLTSLQELQSYQMDIVEKGIATHVVTGILYGADCVFVFDSERMDGSSIQDVQGRMEAVMKKIPMFTVSGKVDIKLTEEEKALTTRFTCKFFGDLLLKSNPGTFEEAVKTYMELPTLLGQNGENAAPLKVWLLPLKSLNSKAPSPELSLISVSLLRKVQDVLEDGQQMEMRCNDSLEDVVAKHFPEICEALRRFQKLCQYYTSFLRQSMVNKLPLIRDGTKDESELAKVFADKEMCPFSHAALSNWLDSKEREITIMRYCINTMDGINVKFVQSKSELDRVLYAPGVNDVLCFVFTSLESSDPQLEAMAQYLDKCPLQKANNNPWYFTDDVIASMKEKVNTFVGIARPLRDNHSLQFVVTAMANTEHAGASIYHYKNAVLLTDNFSKPDIPSVKDIQDKSALMWYACDLHLDPMTVNYNLALSQDNRMVSRGDRKSYQDSPERFDVCSQVLCTDGLVGRHYWEVEWGGGADQDIAIGVTYRGIPRKGKDCYLGWNPISWTCGIYGAQPFPTIFEYHMSQRKTMVFPGKALKRIGVYLDWPGGSLSFYDVSSDGLTHLYSHYATFSEPLYPGCYIYSPSGHVFFCPVQ
ncbi:stonustoxin subunit alpha-like [Dunckerocampus dactyliophorus]|uniref:stonustoxin subunit alpha-like n=1 Tax=Dunckerocampus dactyliophorus TaxID=161453 RepID=UPI0024062198|nr:stonustoxin subunit alpha-like [Dunckerocampus dactyliophorus]